MSGTFFWHKKISAIFLELMKARLNSVKLRKITRMSKASVLLQTGAKVKAGLGGLNPLFVMVYVVKEEMDLKLKEKL